MASILEVLPVETICDIINTIADDDDRQHRCEWPNIKACSLTCRALAGLCRRYIFRCVKLVDFDRSPPQGPTGTPPHPLARSFAKLIAHKPEIADYVREVDFMLNDTDDKSDISSVLALRRLKKVEKLLICPIPRTHPQNWLIPVRALSRTINLILLHCPTLTHVKISDVYGFKISDLAPCTHLQSLTLKGGSIEDEDAPPHDGKSIQLQELNTVFPFPKDAPKLLRLKYKDNTPILNVEGLKVFKSCVYGQDTYSAEVIKSAKHLENLHLFLLPRRDQPPEMSMIVNLLAPLRTLRFLSFSSNIGPMMSTCYYICNSLKILSPTSSIELLNLGFQDYQDLGRTPNHDVLKECILGIGWPSLTRINLSIFNGNKYTRYSRVDSTLQDSSVTFHRLSSDSMLEFRVYNYRGLMNQDEIAYGC